MASRPPFQDQQIQRPSLYTNQSLDEFKAPYEDPEDTTSPYSRHQTYNVDPQAIYTGEHRRGPSYPLQKPVFQPGKQSNEASEHSHAAYPPAVPPPDDNEKIGFWRRVCTAPSVIYSANRPRDRYCLTRWRAGYTSSSSSLKPPLISP